MGALLRFLPGLGPAATALFNPWVILGILAVAAGVFFAGMHLQTQLFEAGHARQLETQIKQIAAFGAEQRQQNAALAAKLNRETAKRRSNERQLAEALRRVPPAELVESACPDSPRAATPSNPAAVAGTGRGTPARILDAGVRLWNERLALGVNDAERRQFLDAADSGTGPVEISDAIQNVADNAAILGECRERELAWHRKACQNGWWVGPECGGSP